MAAELCRSCLWVEWGSEPRSCRPGGAGTPFYVLRAYRVGVQGAGEPEARSHRPCATLDNTEAQRDFTRNLPLCCEKSLLGLVDTSITPSFTFGVIDSLLKTPFLYVMETHLF